jgi:hypothetical protein
VLPIALFLLNQKIMLVMAAIIKISAATCNTLNSRATIPIFPLLTTTSTSSLIVIPQNIDHPTHDMADKRSIYNALDKVNQDL